MIHMGLAGAGWSANTIATAISELEDISILGIYNHNLENAKTIADKFSIPIITSEFKYLCKIEKIKFIIISLPHHLHFKYAKYALNAEKHVLVEKPIAMNVKEGQEMVALARSKKLKLGVNFQNRFSDSTAKAKEIISSGLLGKIINARVEVFLKRDPQYFQNSKWRGKIEKEGGGVLINQSIHEIDRLIYLLGDFKVVCGFYNHLVHDIETEDNAVACFMLNNGVIGTIQTSISVKTPTGAKLIITGSNATIEIRLDRVILWSKNHKNPKVYQSSCVDEKNSIKNIKIENHKRLIKDFASAIKNNHEPLANGDEGIRSLRVIEAIYKSKGLRPISIN
ncbi:MAG: Gfo/Idh/MocA family protein [Promethearchaeota archaeon]